MPFRCRVRQERFLLNPGEEEEEEEEMTESSAYGYKWEVPVTWITSTNPSQVKGYNAMEKYLTQNGQHPPSSYIEFTHPTSPRLLCGQLNRQTGSAVYCRAGGERLGETTGDAVRSQ